MREVCPKSSLSNYGTFAYIKFFALFLEKCCGYTFVSESVNTGSFRSTEKTGTGGAFAGSTFTFTRSGGDSTFASTDLGKWILILDATNPVNCGWYRIIGYTDANTIAIDFRSLPSEYPVAASSLSWWLMADNYANPSSDGNYIRLQTPHADGWQIQLMATYSGNELALRLSLNGDWTATGKILPGTGDLSPAYPRIKGNYGGGENLWCFGLANTEGTMLHLWTYGPTLWYQPQHMCSVSLIEPFDSQHDVASERWALQGVNLGSGGNYFVNPWAHYDSRYLQWGNLVTWQERFNVAKNYCYPLDPTRSWEGEGFSYSSGHNEANARTGKNDYIDGTLMVKDYTNARDDYEIFGIVRGAYRMRRGFSAHKPLSRVTAKDTLHIANGLAVDWPGITPQL